MYLPSLCCREFSASRLVAVPQEVGDGGGSTYDGEGGGLFLLGCFLPFGYAPAKEVIGIKPRRQDAFCGLHTSPQSKRYLY